MEKWVKKSIELLLKLSFLGKKNPAVIPYCPQKCEISQLEHPSLERSKPEKYGITSERLYRMLKGLEAEPRANIHNLLVIKDGSVICECNAPGYDIHMWHLAHSMSKSVTGMAIGILCDEGKLDINRKVYEFFPEIAPKDKSFKKITVKHLLTMQSGIAFNEAGSVSENLWARAFVESKVKFEPGSLFAYNSMNSYMLACIVTRVAKRSLLSLVEERIFKPLNITNYYWEKSPEGIEKGGWGLYLSCESWGKIAMMMLGGGAYEGRRILSEGWVKESTAPHATVPEKAGGFNYGYHIWSSRTSDEFLFNGMLGQNVWMCPKNNIAVIINSENNEMFQKSPALAIIQEYLGGDLSEKCDTGITYRDLKNCENDFFTSRRWIYPRPTLRGISYRLGLKSSTPFPHEWDTVLGKFAFPDNNQGVLPLFIRAMQNNYTGGLESVSFHKHFNTLFMTVCEGGKDIRFEVGLYDHATNVVDFDGEKYVARVLGSAVKNEEGELIHKVEILFPEMPNSRKITIRRLPDKTLSFFMEEIPNHKIAEPFVEALYATNPKLTFVIGLIEKRLGDRFVENKLKKTFAPRLIGVNVKSSDYHRRLYAIQDRNEEKNRSAESAANMLIRLSDEESGADRT